MNGNRRTTLLFGLLLLLTLGCQHARIRFDGCHDCKAEKNEKTQIIKQYYYWWGRSPKTMEYNLNEICPTGPLEVHQYTSWVDGIIENMTIGIMMPKTLAITCK